MLMVFTGVVLADKKEDTPEECTTIQSGELETSGGETIVTGFAENGYNYQAHLFKGAYGNDYLIMKWSDSWALDLDGAIGVIPETGKGDKGVGVRSRKDGQVGTVDDLYLAWEGTGWHHSGGAVL